MTLPRGLDMKAKDREMSLAGGDGKKLKDYPAVPRTPPLEERKDEEVSWLERELDRERIYLSVLQKENSEIEEILRDLEKEVSYVKSHFPQNLDGDGKIHADNEHWFRYEAQMEVNRKLEREKRRLESEIKQMEDEGMINLDSLTQSELLLYVKQLERTKTDLLSDLRAKEWSLDKQAKDFHHLSETKRSLEAQIKHYDGERALFRHYKRIACPSASVPASRQSSQKSSARRVRLAKQGAGEKRLSSLSQENLSKSIEPEVMFRSLDERELKRASPVPGHQRRVSSAPASVGIVRTDPRFSRTAASRLEWRSGTLCTPGQPSSAETLLVYDREVHIKDKRHPTSFRRNKPESAGNEKGEETEEKGSGGVEARQESTLHQSTTPPDQSKTEPRIHFKRETLEKKNAGSSASSEETCKTVTTGPTDNSRFSMTIRITGRIVSNRSGKYTINAVEATVLPRQSK